jgi:hypothetical protein
VRTVAKPLPDMISPGGHVAIDYLIAGAFLAAAGLFWKRNKPAAAASLVCGGAHLGVTLLTDYAGGVHSMIPFSTRRKLDLGIAAMTTAIPKFLNFEDEPERRFFTAQGIVMTLTNELTRFPHEEEFKRKKKRFAA